MSSRVRSRSRKGRWRRYSRERSWRGTRITTSATRCSGWAAAPRAFPTWKRRSLSSRPCSANTSGFGSNRRSAAPDVKQSRQRRPASRPRPGIFLEGGEQRLGELGGDLRPELARVRRRLGEVGEPDLRQAAAGKRRLAGQALEEDTTERVDVARLGRFEALDQLGREVV